MGGEPPAPRPVLGAQARGGGEKKAGGVEGKCYKIVCAQNAFHGRTYGALSATWEKKYRTPFAPLVPGFSHVPYNDLAALSQAMARASNRAVNRLEGSAQGSFTTRTPWVGHWLRGGSAWRMVRYWQVSK